MKPRLRRFTAFATFAVVFAFAPLVHADERGGSLRAAWAAFWTWFTPPPADATAPRFDSEELKAGGTIDPFGRGPTPPPPGAASGVTSENQGDPAG